MIEDTKLPIEVQPVTAPVLPMPIKAVTPVPVAEPEVQSVPAIAEPKLLDSGEAIKRAQGAHSLVERACVVALDALDHEDGGYHEEVACARSAIRTLLFQLRAGWPGGKKVVED